MPGWRCNRRGASRHRAPWQRVAHADRRPRWRACAGMRYGPRARSTRDRRHPGGTSSASAPARRKPCARPALHKTPGSVAPCPEGAHRHAVAHGESAWPTDRPARRLRTTVGLAGLDGHDRLDGDHLPRRAQGEVRPLLKLREHEALVQVDQRPADAVPAPSDGCGGAAPTRETHRGAAQRTDIQVDPVLRKPPQGDRAHGRQAAMPAMRRLRTAISQAGASARGGSARSPC